MSEQTTDEESWVPRIFHSESVFYRMILSEVPTVHYITKERDWLLESICKAVVRLQVDGRVEKNAIRIFCHCDEHMDWNDPNCQGPSKSFAFEVIPEIGWDFSEEEGCEFLARESWGEDIVFADIAAEMEKEYADAMEEGGKWTGSPQKGAILVFTEELSELEDMKYLKAGRDKVGLISKSMNETLAKEDLPGVLLRVGIVEEDWNMRMVSDFSEPKRSVQKLRMHKKPKVGRFIDDLVKRRGWDPQMDEGEREELINTVTGQTTSQIREVLSLSMAQMGKFDNEFIKWNSETTNHIIGGSDEGEDDLNLPPGMAVTFAGEIETSTTRFKDIAGIDAYVDWVNRTAMRFTEEATEFGFVGFPRGALLLGPPGTGKTTMAKATANCWDFGILRVRAPDLLKPLWGQTEATLKKIFKKAENGAPCILFLDEMEKLFDQQSGSGSDFMSGSKGMFLEFMQENPSPVFVIGTTNSIGSLPPEMVERFDSRWFVDLPGIKAREDILRIHLGRAKQELDDEILKVFANQTEGHSGRGLEDIVTEAMSLAFYSGSKKVGQKHLEQAIRAAKPVSLTHGHVIKELQTLVEEGKVADASGKSRSSKNDDDDDVGWG